MKIDIHFLESLNPNLASTFQKAQKTTKIKNYKNKKKINDKVKNRHDLVS